MQNNTINLLSLFSGIGAFEKALKKANLNYRLVNFCEVDKYASKSYSIIHDEQEDLNLGDIRNNHSWNINQKIDLITYGFPCQDISLAGKQKGIIKGETRSGLFFEALDVIKRYRPSVAICENVKALTSSKFKDQFQAVLQGLDEAGYVNNYQVLNAKDFGIPQNRERVFIVSIRKDLYTGFEFPKPFKLDKRLKDVLEENVPEKFYIKNERAANFLKTFDPLKISDKPVIQRIGSFNSRKTASTLSTTGIACPLMARDYKDPITCLEQDSKILQYKGNLYPSSGNPQAGRIYNQEGLSPALDTCQGGNRQPKILQECTSIQTPIIVAARGRKDNNSEKEYTQQFEINKSGCSNSLTRSLTINLLLDADKELKIRKLTPLEYWRLMGFDDEDFYKAQKINSNTQLYKQAGNSIAVDVLYYLFRNIYNEQGFLKEYNKG